MPFLKMSIGGEEQKGELLRLLWLLFSYIILLLIHITDEKGGTWKFSFCT